MHARPTLITTASVFTLASIWVSVLFAAAPADHQYPPSEGYVTRFSDVERGEFLPRTSETLEIPESPELGSRAGDKSTSHEDLDWVQQPLAAEYLDTSDVSDAPNSVVFGGPVDPYASIGTGGYDALVDSYVHQLLTVGPPSRMGRMSPTELPDLSEVPSYAAHWPGLVEGNRYFTLSAMGMTREDGARVPVSYLLGDPYTSVLSDENRNWMGGVEGRFGLLRGPAAIELAYWQLLPEGHVATVTDPSGGLQAFTGLDDLFVSFDDASLHQIENEFELQNLEVDCLRRVVRSDARVQMAYSLGVRYTRLKESLRFRADLFDQILDGSLGEWTYAVDIDNRLVGPQVGSQTYLWLSPRCGLVVSAKTGLLANIVTHSQQVSDSVGTAQIVAGPDTGSAYDLTSENNNFAISGELRIDFNFEFTDRCKASWGYRALGISGIAAPYQQVPERFGDLDAASQVDHNGHLLLHGAHAGLEVTF